MPYRTDIALHHSRSICDRQHTHPLNFATLLRPPAASAACFYAPFKQVKNWSWETMWSIGGFMSWLILPWGVSYVLLPDFWHYYGSFSTATLLPVFLFGAMWGSNINYGLTMRYLGMVIVSYAGLLKERVMGIRAEELNLKKGLVLAVMCGIFFCHRCRQTNASSGRSFRHRSTVCRLAKLCGDYGRRRTDYAPRVIIWRLPVIGL